MTTTQKIALIISGFVVLAGGIVYVLYRNSNKGKEDGAGGLDEKIQKGSKGDGAKAVQVIINQIAQWRGWNGTTRKSPNGVNVTFPINQEGTFDRKSDAAARLIFASYPTNNSITRHMARLKWAYAQGYYKKPLDENLKNSSRKAEYEREWTNGSKARK